MGVNTSLSEDGIRTIAFMVFLVLLVLGMSNTVQAVETSSGAEVQVSESVSVPQQRSVSTTYNSSSLLGPGCTEDILMEKVPPLQPVQVVWQDDPDWNKLVGDQENLPTKDSKGDMEYKGTEDRTTQVWEAGVEMVKGKKTKLFGFNRNNYKHGVLEVEVFNFYTQSKEVSLKLSSEDPSFVHLPEKSWTIPAAETTQGDCNDPGSKIIEIPLPKDGLPEDPFELTSKNKEIMLEAEVVNPDGSTIQDSKVSNHVAHTKTITKVSEKSQLHVLYIPVKLDFQKPISGKDLKKFNKESTKFLKGTFPVDEDKLKGEDTDLGFITLYLSFGKKPSNEKQMLKQISRIYNQLHKAATELNYDRVVGVVRKDSFKKWWGHIKPSLNDSIGLSLTTDDVAVLSETGDPATPAHEIGHTYDLWRGNAPEEYAVNNPGNPANGYWVLEEKNMDGKTGFMGLGMSNYNNIGNWVGKYDYLRLLDKLNNPDPEIISITGNIWKNGSAEFTDSFKKVPNGTIDQPLGEKGNYTIAFVNESGVLNTTGFDESFEQEDGVIFDQVFFGLRTQWVEGTTRIELRNSTGATVAVKNVSKNPPEVTNPTVSKSGGEFTFSWEASDPDGDKLTYSVAAKIGGEWLPLSLKTDKKQISFNTSALENASKIRVRANDGVNTGEIVFEPNASALSIPEAIAGANDKIEFNELQEAINYWVTGKEVPGTNGKTVDFSTLQNLISLWVSGNKV